MIPLVILLTLSAIAPAQNYVYWEKLPERVATHFGMTGQPDAWMDKTSAMLMMLGAQVGLPWFLVGVGFVVRYLPSSLINIPNREYWLHADRRESSLAYIRNFVTVIAITASLFMMSISHLTFVANVRGQPLNLSAFGTVMVLYLVGVALMVSALWRRFRRPH